MAKVYRIENTDGIGPYRSFNGAYFINTDIKLNRPGPYSDIGPEFDTWGSAIENYYFGFESLEALLTWFDSTEELFILKRHNFTCNVYDIPIDVIKRGRCQLAFLKEHKTAMPIEVIPL